MGKWLLVLGFLLAMSLPNGGFGISVAKAVYDPLSVPNNRYGVHILEPSEIFNAAKLVNSNGGKWGYVTIPIRTDDRNKNKWHNFMIGCRQNSIIPILRISSYASGSGWVTPPESELTDFANFLNDLPWPVKNRYIVMYNEPNHSQEWGGYVSPNEYAKLLVTAHDIFKQRSQDFFLISAGLDMSAPDSATSMDALQYLRKMTVSDPKWYASVDGLAVHAYPNPDFRSSVWSTSRYGITSYRFEISLLKSLGYSPKPVFITETGYLGSDDQFFRISFTQIWTDKNIVAITPFVLFAGAGDFIKFSLLDNQYQPTDNYLAIYSRTKSEGSPLLNEIVLTDLTPLSYSSPSPKDQSKISFLQRIIRFFFPHKPSVTINDVILQVELADNPVSRAKGLSDRKSLDKDSGMLFQFPSSSIQTFWMKGMKFALDFIWINNGKVVNIHENIPQPLYVNDRPVVLSSVVPVNQVLEVNSGFVSQNKIKIGDQVVVNLTSGRR